MKFPLPKQELPAFQLTAMLDVVFLLLCFFVTTSVYSQWENEVEIRLPTADSSREPTRLPGEIVINVDREGVVRVNQRELSAEELGEKCALLARNFPGTPVVVRGDKAASWEAVMGVIDVCVRNGLFDINFSSAIPDGAAADSEPPPAAVGFGP